MSRWKAALIHLALSLVVFSGLLAIIMLLWYPGILFSIDGGWNGLKILMGVDVVLGPLLTLVVFKADKPSLKFDLSCIVLIQAVCMAGGLWVVYQSRPIALVFAYDTFYSLAANEFVAYEKDPAELSDFPGPWPKLVYTQLPEGEAGAQIAVIRSQFFGNPLFLQTENYRAIPENFRSIYGPEEEVVEAAGTLIGPTNVPADEECILTRFVSAHAGGFVCFDPLERRLSRYFPDDNIEN